MESEFLTNVKVSNREKGERVFSEGDPSDNRLYFILSGAVSIMKAAPGGTERQINKLAAGEFFGEIALLTDAPRTATVVVTSDNARFAFFDRGSFIAETAKNIKFAYSLFKGAVQRQGRVLSAMRNLRIPPNPELPDESPGIIEKLRRRNLEIADYVTIMRHQFVSQDQSVFEEGDAGNGYIYFLMKGDVRKYLSIDGKDQPVAYLLPGDFFGQENLVSQEERQYSARVFSTDARLVFLDRQLFLKTIKLNPEFFFNMFKTVIWNLVHVERLYRDAKERQAL